MQMNIRMVALNFAVCFFAVFAVWAVPRGNYVLVITSPYETNSMKMQIIASANGSIVASGHYDWITVAYSEKPGFASRLMKAGALLVLNNNLAVGCVRNDNGIFG